MVKITGGNGSSIEKAIIISECNNLEGIEQEYIEVKKRFGKCSPIKQTLLNVEGRAYDKLELNIESGEIEIFFDITDFLGKKF